MLALIVRRLRRRPKFLSEMPKNSALRNLLILAFAMLSIAIGAQAIAASTDSSLSALAPSSGTLQKMSDGTSGFSSTQLSYRLAVPYGTNSLTLTPTAAESAATIEFSTNGGGSYTALTSGTASNNYVLAAGVNIFKIRVTSPDSSTSTTYEVRAIKDLPDNTPELQISFTGMTALPPLLAVVGPHSLEVAWTQGSDLSGAAWINIPDASSTALSYVPVPTLAAGTVTSGQTWFMTIRGEVSEAANRTNPDLYGFVGASSTTAAATVVTNGSQFMKEVLSLGQFTHFATISNAFYGSTSQLVISCKLPETVTSLSNAFASSTFNHSGVASWDVKNVNSFNWMFKDDTAFNQNLSAWYTGAATNMNSMFRGATSFNASIATWDTSNVSTFFAMFFGATAFNQPLNNWDTHSVTSNGFQSMFSGATSFNQPLNNWDISNATSLVDMFSGASSFNQDLSSWSTSRVTLMTNLFTNAISFNNGMPSGSAGTFTWNTAAVTNMYEMFRNAIAFNQSIDAWNVGNVTDVTRMFFAASKFNQPLNSWNTAKFVNVVEMFNQAVLFNQPLSNWNTASITDMANMFMSAVKFNQNLNNWNISKVTSLNNMFNNAQRFNNGLSSGASGAMTWTMGSKLTSAVNTFNSAYAFNQDMSSWNTNALVDAKGFIATNTSSFDQSLAFLNVGNYAGSILTNSTTALIGFPPSMSQNNVLASLDAWANRPFSKSKMSTFTFVLQLSGAHAPYTDCHSKSNFTSITSTGAWATFSGGVAGSGDTGCANAPTVTWSPIQTPTDATYSAGVARFTPSTLPTAAGYSGSFSYVVANSALNGNCTVSPAGEITFTVMGNTCTIKAYTADLNTSIASATVTFNVDVAPSAPTITSTQMFSTVGIDANFTAGVNSGSALTRFEFSTDNGATWRTVRSFSPNNLSTATQVSFRGESSRTDDVLVPGTNYPVQVRAVNTLAGQASNAYFQMFEISPSSPVITGVVPGDKSLSVSFTVSNLGSSIQAVRYSTDGGTNWLTASGVTSPITIDTATNTGLPLSNGTGYNIRVRADNNFTGNISSNALGYPDIAPGAPTITGISSTATKISVAFTSGTNAGSSLTKYQYSTDGGTTWKDGTTASGNTSPVSFTALSSSTTLLAMGTTYPIQIRAYNSRAGAATASTDGSLTDAAPSAPTSVVVTNGSKSVSVSFAAATANGTAVTKYQYSTDGGTTWRDRASGTTASPLVITTASSDNSTLIDGTTYPIKIRAFNTIAGTASAQVTGVPETAPGTPTNVVITSLNQQLSVAFTAPENDGSALTKYRYSTNGGTTWKDAVGTTSPLIISTVSTGATALINGTSYNVSIQAFNTVNGAATTAVAATPGTVPGAPTLGTPVPGNSKITVSWTAPASDGGSAITGYTASTTVGGFSCTTTGLTCEIAGLTNGTQYSVRVIATNAFGDSVASGSSAARPEVLPGAPTITSVTVGDKLIYVYFTAPADNGGSTITKYKYTTNGGTGSVQLATTTSPLTIDKNTVDAGALVNGSSYSIQIAAVNTGTGTWSTVQSATPNILPEVPTSVTGVIGGGKITVSWNASAGNAGTAVTGYTVTSDPGGFTCSTTGATTCEVLGLTNGVAYTFTVAAANALGNSAASSPSIALKPDVAPGAPTGVAVTRGDGSLTFSFTPGTNSGSPIVKYQYSLNGISWSDFPINSATSSQTLSGLTNGFIYTVDLRAVNTLEGAASSTVTASPRAAPGAPTNFTAAAGYKQITVSWSAATSGSGGNSSPGTNGGEAITKYQYQLDGGAWVDFAGTSSPQIISGLTNAVAYSIKIRAYSDIAGVATSALSATPVKLAQSALALGFAENVNWTISNVEVTVTYSVNGALTLQTNGGSGTGQVVYAVSNDSLCSVVNNTLLIQNAGQACRVTATKVSDGDYSSKDSQTVQVVVERAQQMPLVWKSQISLTYGQSFDVAYSGGSGNGAVTIASDSPTKCSVVGNRVYGVGQGLCIITISKQYSTNYHAAQVNQPVMVGRAVQSVSFTSQVPAAPLAGDTYTATATATSGATPTFTQVSGNCTVAGSQVSFTASGACTIRATASKANYFDASSTQIINVGQRNQTLTFAPSVQSLTSKTFGAPAFYADASSNEPTLTPTYALGAATTNNSCSVSSLGIVQLLAAGDCEIEVTQAGDLAVAAASPISKLFTVLPDQASQPFITSVSAGHQSITVSFVKPSYSGGSAITAYRVDAVWANGTESTSACQVDPGTIQTCTISGLTNGTSYRVKVAAITLAGAGIFSDPAEPRLPATNPAAVTAFTAIPDNTTIALNWDDPISLGGGTFDSYRIFFKRSSEANYPSSYINVQSQTPTSYTITGLINGEAYDVKIVTVTTANTASLVSNTAEVKETPRTVPDSPATVDVIEVAGNVVITWSAPQSDGGNAISEYTVTVNGTICTLTSSLATLCEIPVPTSSGTYPIEVKAKNDAGYSAPALATFTKAAAPSSGSTNAPSSGSGGHQNGGTETAPTEDKTIQIISLNVKNVKTLGGVIVEVTGKNLADVTTVLIDGIKAKIVSVTDSKIRFVAPANSNGPATLELKSPVASAQLIDALIYTNGVVRSGVAWVYKYVQAHTLLSTKAKSDLRAGLNKYKGTVSITCVGYQSYSYNTPKDAATAIGRAQQACSYLKKINPKLKTKTAIARTSLVGPASRKLAVQFRTTK